MRYLREHWQYLTSAGTYPGVDLLRAFAITTVLLYHFEFMRVGWIGVDLFFVISGFLIGGMIVDKAVAGRFRFGDFYLRRALRILPIYYVIILLCAIFKAPPGSFDMRAAQSMLSAVFFLQSAGPYFFPDHFQLVPEYLPGGAWSLVIEECFYLVAPLALIAFVKLTRCDLRMVSLLVGLVVLSGIWTRLRMTAGFAPDDGNWHFASFIQFHSRYDELAAGVLAACLIRVMRGVRTQSAWWLSAAAILAWVFLAYIYNKPEFLIRPYIIARDTIWLPTLLASAGVCALLGSFWWPIKATPVIVLARLSYPLYLVHILFLELTNPHGEHGLFGAMKAALTWHGRAVVFIMYCVLLSYLASLMVEFPFIRLYKRPSVREVDASEIERQAA